MKKWLVRAATTLWLGLFTFGLSSPLFFGFVFFVGGLGGFIFISWIVFLLWGIIYYLLLSQEEVMEKARKNLESGDNGNWFWRRVRFLKARGGRIWVFAVFLIAGPQFALPLVKISGKGNLTRDLPVLLVGCLLSSFPLMVAIYWGIAWFFANLFLGEETVGTFVEVLKGWLSAR